MHHLEEPSIKPSLGSERPVVLHHCDRIPKTIFKPQQTERIRNKQKTPKGWKQ